MKKGYTPVGAIRQNIFKINQAASLTGTSPRALRYYEALGLIPSTKRSRGRLRLYSLADIELIKKIKKLQAQGFSLLEIKNKLTSKIKKPSLKIFIDSTFSITPEEAFAKGIEIIPMNIHFGKTIYQDYFTLSPKKFSEIYEKKYSIPRTSAPTSEEYLEIFRKAIEQGPVLSLHADSRIASSYSSALSAAQKLGAAPLEVIDTKLLALEFREFYARYRPGMTILEIKKLLEEIRNTVSELYIIDKLDQSEFTDQFFKLFYGCYPLFQHTAKSGLVPLGRFESFTAAEKYLKQNAKNLVKNNRLLSCVLQTNFGYRSKGYLLLKNKS